MNESKESPSRTWSGRDRAGDAATGSPRDGVAPSPAAPGAAAAANADENGSERDDDGVASHEGTTTADRGRDSGRRAAEDEDEEEERRLFDDVVRLVREGGNGTGAPLRTPSDATRLRLYGLYKRATAGRLVPPSHAVDDGVVDGGEGDDNYYDVVVRRDRPSAWSVAARAKHDAWAACSVGSGSDGGGGGISRRRARMDYVDLALRRIFPRVAGGGDGHGGDGPDDDDDDNDEEDDDAVKSCWELHRKLRSRAGACIDGGARGDRVGVGDHDCDRLIDDDDNGDADEDVDADVVAGEAVITEVVGGARASSSPGHGVETAKNGNTSVCPCTDGKEAPHRPDGITARQHSTSAIRQRHDTTSTTKGGRGALNDASESSRGGSQHPSTSSLSSSSTSSPLPSMVRAWVERVSVHPRGRLDIAVPDLLFALGRCLRYAGGWGGSGGWAEATRVTHERDVERWWIDNMTATATDAAPASSKTGTVSVRVPRVLVASSVRSGFDLYLRARNFPPGSELVTSAIQIESMVRIAEYHGLRVVPVDCQGLCHGGGGGSDEGGGSSNSSSGGAMATFPPVAPSLRDIESALTDRTVAVMIVHPFGTVGYSEDEFAALRGILTSRRQRQRQRRGLSSSSTARSDGNGASATANAAADDDDDDEYDDDANAVMPGPCVFQRGKIDLLEDCAQCFAGPLLSSGYSYGGSRHSDFAFFSFGTIKTRTALGGGIVVVRGEEEESGGDNGIGGDGDGDGNKFDDDSDSIPALFDRMQRIQGRYPVQANGQFLLKVIRAAAVLLVTSSPLLYGLLVSLCSALRIDFDRLATSAVRGYVVATNGAGASSPKDCSSFSSPNEMTPPERMRNFVRLLRVRPSPAVLALLHRRLSTCDGKVATSRIERCRRLAALIGRRVPAARALVLGADYRGASGRQRHLYWLFPVIVDDPDLVGRRMLEHGFDVPRGTSQMGYVASFVTDATRPDDAGRRGANSDEEERRCCPEARSIMSRVLYLPISSCVLSPRDAERLVLALVGCTDGGGEVGWFEGGGKADRDGIPPHGFGPPLVARSRVVLMVFFLLLWIWDRRFCPGALGALYLHLLHLLPLALSFSVMVVFCVSLTCHLLGPGYLESTALCGNFAAAEDRSVRPSSSRDNEHGPRDSPFRLSEIGPLRLPMASHSRGLDGSTSSGCDPELAYCQRRALLTGATGFVGSMVLRDLLLYKDEVGIEGGVVLLCRAKGKRSARERVEALLRHPMFSFLSADERKSDLIIVIESDVTRRGLGLREADRRSLSGLCVTHAIHCAATVSFVQPLDEAARANITPTLQVQALAKEVWGAKFIYISTAFVHGKFAGSPDAPLREELFSLGKFDPYQLYRSMVETQSLASSAMCSLGFPNTYTFSKCVCEHLLLRDKSCDTIIIRPSIVGPSVASPWEGWAGSRPSTLVAAACLFMNHQWSLWSFSAKQTPVIPVDVVSRFILCTAFVSHPSHSKTYGTPQTNGFCRKKREAPLWHSVKRIHNATWDWTSPARSSFAWSQFAEAAIQLGAVQGYCSRLTAILFHLVNVRLIPTMNLSHDTFILLHRMFVRVPFKVIHSLYTRLQPRKAKSIEYLLRYLELPILFLHFSNSTFCFKSDLIAPKRFDGERYLSQCCFAADCFVRQIDPDIGERSKTGRGKKARQIRARIQSLKRSRRGSDMSSFMVAGRSHIEVTSDFWWALTQPRGNLVIRAAGFILKQILRCTASELSVDLKSFSALAQTMREEENKAGARPHIVLVPTHRSLFDFLILSYVCFALPELGVPIPYICASEDFARIPLFGKIARLANAFFVRRGRGRADPDLAAQVAHLKKRGPTCFEVFIEGKRSRDRRFVRPRTGFLRCLLSTGGSHVVLPVAISYERIPEQSTFTDEIDRAAKTALGIPGLLRWLKSVVRDDVNIGRVHVAAAPPFTMPKGACPVQITRKVQQLQQHMIYVSKYHVNAGSVALKIQPETIECALKSIGCKFWPQHGYEKAQFVTTPGLESQSETWTILLQYGHYFAPYFADSHPEWAEWLSPTFIPGGFKQPMTKSASVGKVVQRMKSHFDDALRGVEDTFRLLEARGFSHPRPAHLLQYVGIVSSPPPLLASAVLSMNLHIRNFVQEEEKKEIDDSFDIDDIYGVSGPSDPLFERGQQLDPTLCKLQFIDESLEYESFGAWGFNDSFFVLNVDDGGSKSVTMKGSRYSISGRSLTRLVPFIEKELGITLDPDKISLPVTARSPFVLRSEIGETDIKKIKRILLENSNANVETSVSIYAVDRVRHGTGQTQHDMYILRSGLTDEIRVPDAVVWPSSESEVVALVELSKRERWCLIPFGGGTNVSHATRCPSKDEEPRPIISVDMKRMNRIIWVNEEDGVAHVEAGITGRTLVTELENRGLTFGHEPDSIEFSTLGGWIATKASGMKRNRYGNIEDIVKEVRVVGPNGVLWQHHSSNFEDRKRSAQEQSAYGRAATGADLCSLMLGSEGCLGIIASAVIRVWPIAECKEFESVVLPSFRAGLDFVRDVARMHSLKPASVRLVDNAQFRMGQVLKQEPTSLFEKATSQAQKLFLKAFRGFDLESVVGVTIVFEGSNMEVHLQKKIIKSLSVRHSGLLAGESIGRAGYDLTFAIAYLRDFAMSYYCLGESFETFVPWSKVDQLVATTKERIYREHSSRCLPGKPFVSCRVTQLYDEGACVYFYFCIYFENVRNPSSVFAKIEIAAREEILANGGNLSHHHGCGKTRSHFMKQICSKPLHQALLKMKSSFDEENIFGASNGLFAHNGSIGCEAVET